MALLSNRNNASITLTDNDYSELQIHRDKTTRTPATPPTLAPNVELQGVNRLMIELNFSYPTTPEGNKRALPDGVSAIQIQEVISDTEELQPGAAFLAVETIRRSSTKLNFAPEEAGKWAVFRARYQNSRGVAGPWSANRTIAIQA